MAEITLVDVESQFVLGMRKRGAYEEIAGVLDELFQYARSHGAEIVGPPIAIMHEAGREEAEMADREKNAVLDMALPVANEVEGTDAITGYLLHGGTMAKTVHKGPYEDCGPAYTGLLEWIQKSGKRIIGPPREVYLNDPREVPPEELLTEIYAPVA